MPSFKEKDESFSAKLLIFIWVWLITVKERRGQSIFLHSMVPASPKHSYCLQLEKKKYPVLSNFWNFHRQPWKGTQKRHPKEMLQDSSGELFPYSLTLCYQKEERGWTWSLLKYKLSSCWSSYSKSRVGGGKNSFGNTALWFFCCC